MIRVAGTCFFYHRLNHLNQNSYRPLGWLKSTVRQVSGRCLSCKKNLRFHGVSMQKKLLENHEDCWWLGNQENETVHTVNAHPMNQYTVHFGVFARGQVVRTVQVAEASNPLVPTGHPAGFGLDFALDESITQLAQRILGHSDTVGLKRILSNSKRIFTTRYLPIS